MEQVTEAKKLEKQETNQLKGSAKGDKEANERKGDSSGRDEATAGSRIKKREGGLTRRDQGRHAYKQTSRRQRRPPCKEDLQSN